MTVIRILALCVLALLTVGFGLCAMTSAVFAIGAPPLLLLTAVTGALTWACIAGMRALLKTDEADADGAATGKTGEPNEPPAR